MGNGPEVFAVMVTCGQCYQEYDAAEGDGSCPCCGSDEIVGERG